MGFLALFANWKSIFAAIVTAAIVGSVAYGVGQWRGWSQGYAEYERRVLMAELEAERQRKKDDAEIQRMSDYDLCVSMSRGGDVLNCDSLRLRGPSGGGAEPNGVSSVD